MAERAAYSVNRATSEEQIARAGRCHSTSKASSAVTEELRWVVPTPNDGTGKTTLDVEREIMELLNAFLRDTSTEKPHHLLLGFPSFGCDNGEEKKLWRQ
jgi:hypothetical protein